MNSRILLGLQFTGKICAILCFVFFTCWCFFAVLFSDLPIRSMRILGSIVFLVAIALLISFSKGSMMIRLVPPMILNVVVLIWWLLIPPRTDRTWSPDQAVLPAASLDGTKLRVSNIRNCSYRTTKDYTVGHYDRTFDLDELDSLWFGVEPFADFRGAAHTFLSFGWSDGTFLAVSVEIRKEKGESFSALKGMFKQFEL